MFAVIRAELELRARLVSNRLGGGYYVSPFTFGYLDQLLNDLGLPPADRHKPLFQVAVRSTRSARLSRSAEQG
jgi:hypothetical protein